MQSQKLTRSTARHLRRKRMNLARKAEKLSESSEGSLIINENIQKSIKNTINLQIIESLDSEKETKCSESATSETKSNKSGRKNKNITSNQDNKQQTHSFPKESSLSLGSTNNQLNVNEKDSKSSEHTKKTKAEQLEFPPTSNTQITNMLEKDSKSSHHTKKTKPARIELQAGQSAVINNIQIVEALENQKPVVENCVGSNKEKESEAKPNDKSMTEDKDVTNKEKEAMVSKEAMEPKANATEGKSKAQLRAERRAIQEAQRAKKAQMKEQKETEKKPPSGKPAEPKKQATAAPPAKKEKAPTVAPVVVSAETVSAEKKSAKKVVDHHVMGVFDHLAHNDEPLTYLNADVHPAIVKLGVKYAEGKASGSDCRCVALLFALKRFIKDYEGPEEQDFVRGLEGALNKAMDFLNKCRPISVTMQNALRRLRWQMSLIKSTESGDEVKKIMKESIDTYIREQILLAGEAISRRMQSRINDGDVILTYGHSSLVKKILSDAHDKGKKFRVIVVDSRPRLEGKSMLQHLVKQGIECTYVLITALSFIMPQVSMVLLGAHSILANGAIMARVGTAQVALMGKDFGVPVLVASEMNKSDDNALTDSFVYNELDNSDELTETFDDTKKSPLVNWKSRKSLNLLNLAYDVTPASLITSVITELAIVPCSSIPVVLRIKPWEV